FWVEDWATLPRWGRCLLALPSGRLLISRGNAQTSPWLWQHDGLAATWNPYNAKSPICNTRLNNRTLVGRPFDMLGEAEMKLEELMELVASWVEIGGKSLNKPTKFEVVDGKF
ncbi:MAG: hypothetical protein AAB401_12900, partial [Acidobacteriota bacterium]